jgi:uncharacterized protein
MHTYLAGQLIHYDGSQARSGWIAATFGLVGEAIVAFQGGCDVLAEHMLDTEDLEAGHSIRAALMLHFLVEHPGIDLALATARQRLLAALVKDVLSDDCGVGGLRREGDDLYLGERKLSISVAAQSPTSCLIHFALNVDPTGAPVPAVGLAEWGLEPQAVAEAVMRAYAREIASCANAAAKVRGAR